MPSVAPKFVYLGPVFGGRRIKILSPKRPNSGHLQAAVQYISPAGAMWPRGALLGLELQPKDFPMQQSPVPCFLNSVKSALCISKAD